MLTAGLLQFFIWGIILFVITTALSSLLCLVLNIVEMQTARVPVRSNRNACKNTTDLRQAMEGAVDYSRNFKTSNFNHHICTIYFLFS